MAVAELITSLQNPRVKNVVRLSNRRHRERRRETVVEGVRESSLALSSGVIPVEAFICPKYLEADDIALQLEQLARTRRTRLFEVSSAVYDKMAYRSGSGGVLLVIPYLNHVLRDLSLSERPLVAVVDGAEKPGNLGAVLRTADATGVDALLLTDEDVAGTDIHNPNAIRASLGAFFTVPLVATTREEALSWFKEHSIVSVAATPYAAKPYTAVPFTGPTAIIMGSESEGLGRAWLEAADCCVRIPMAGAVDSLNLSVSTALMLYEALRQRGVEQAGSVLAGNGA